MAQFSLALKEMLLELKPGKGIAFQYEVLSPLKL